MASEREREERIPQEFLDRAHRRLCREIAGQLLIGMAEADVSFKELASRMEVSEIWVRRWFKRLMDGTAPGLREISDLACAVGGRIAVNFHRIEGDAKDE